MTRALGVSLGLGVLFCLTLASADPVDLAIGTAVGAALTLALGRRLRVLTAPAAPARVQRVLGVPPFLAAVLADVVRGTWDVALRVLHLRHLDHPGLVRIPLGERSERGVAVSALVLTLSPGSVLVDVDEERGELVMHVVDASDPDALRAHLQHFYDRYQRRVFP